MAASDADAAARVIERLLVDPAFRAEFRRDPAAACRAAGLDELAEEMAFGAGKAMQTLEVRESRSSLAGVMMAAALEGIGVFGFANHVVPAAINAPGLVQDVLSRVNLPRVDAPLDGLRGALAHASPAPAAAHGAEDQAAAAATPAQAASAAAAPVAPAPADPAAAGAGAPPAPGDAAAGGSGTAPRSGDAGATAANTPADAPPEVAPAAATAQDVHYEEASPDEVASPPATPAGAASPPAAPAGAASPPAAPADAASPQAPADAASPNAADAVGAQRSGAPVDPEQFGAEGKGGPPDAAALALLDNRNVVLDGDGVADIKAGRIDPRVVAVLTKLSEKHKISVSCMCSDHPRLTTGGSVSNHHFGRGIDIAAIDGAPVNANNAMAHDVAMQLSSLDARYRPSEIGTPWALPSDKGYFTDAGHSDHLHVAFDDPIERSWSQPATEPAAGTPADPAAASTAPPTAGTPADPAAASTAPPAAAPAGSSTLTFEVTRSPGASKGAPGTVSFSVVEPGAGRAAPGVAPAPVAAAASAGAEQLVADGAAQSAAGAKAMAALAEATKYKGTPYLWGGSSPKTGFDCSGLVQWAYARQGIQIPRISEQQVLAGNGTTVDRKDLVPGDLVFFRDPSGDVHHVGISMGGDKFLHAPHTGDVVKESSLDEPYYAQQFTGGRRFDDTPVDSPAAVPQPAAVDAAHVALARDAAAAQNPGTLIFKALAKQEASHHNSTVQFLRAIRPEEARGFRRAAVPVDAPAAGALDPAALAGALEYPGDDATKQQLAAWLAASAQKAGLPPELPVMAALVESGVANLHGGDADSVGFFQMRVGIWNKGAYAGYPDNPALQVKWFIDHALAVKQQRLAAGDAGFGKDPSTWGNWIADIERPAEQYRGRYQERLAQAQALLGRIT